MSDTAKKALRRRARINQIMMRPESFRERLNRVVNLFPVHLEDYK